MKILGPLGVLFGVVALAWFFWPIPDNEKMPESYGQTIDLSKGEAKSYFYLVKWEYTVEQKVPVQFEKVTGLPEPPPGFVMIKERVYASGVYKWSGKPFKAFYESITADKDSLGTFYRMIDIKQL